MPSKHLRCLPHRKRDKDSKRRSRSVAYFKAFAVAAEEDLDAFVFVLPDQIRANTALTCLQVPEQLVFLSTSRYDFPNAESSLVDESAQVSTPGKCRFVFVSHDGKDTWVARQIAREIRAAGAYPFLDEAEVGVGDDFEERILEFLDKADELLVLLTPWALDRPYVWAELGVAWGRRIPIVGVLYGMTAADLQARPGMPIFLKRRDLIDINAIEQYFEELARRAEGGEPT
jgi:TIR domain